MFRHSKQGAVDVIRGTAPFNSDVRESFEETVANCLAAGSGQIVVDLADVPLISSTGLELLVESQEWCLQRGGALKIAAPGPLCRDILRVTGVDGDVEVFRDVVTAVGSFAQ
jgi:anti-sigma B factor antagonist